MVLYYVRLLTIRGDDLENNAHGHLINMISNRIKRLADENLVNENVTVEQVKLMGMICRSGGTVSQKEIELAFGVRRSTVTSAMQNLEKKGYIERQPNPEDSRSKLVTLTPAGLEKNKKLRSFLDVLEGRLMKGFTEEESEALRALLLKALDNI